MSSREAEAAHLVGKGLSNADIAAGLFISRGGVPPGQHLRQIQHPQQLRRLAGQWREPAAV